MKASVKIKDILLLLFFIGYWLRYFTNLSIVYSFAFFCIVVIGTFYLFFSRICIRDLKKKYSILLIVDIMAALAICFNNNHTLADWVLLLAWQSMGFLIYISLGSPKFLRCLSMISGYYIIILVIFRYFVLGKENIFISERAGENTISILLLLFVGIDLLICEFTGNRINHIFYLMALAATFLAGGVAGIMTMGCLIFGIYFLKYGNGYLLKIKRIVMLTILIVILIAGKGLIENIIHFAQSGDWNQRMMMIQTYFDMAKESIFNIIFGANIESNAFLFHYRNLHNSFFNWHYFYGIIPFLFFLWIVIRDSVYLAKKKQYVLFVFSIAIFLRSLTDETSYAYMMLWIAIFFMYKNQSLVGEPKRYIKQK